MSKGIRFSLRTVVDSGELLGSSTASRSDQPDSLVVRRRFYRRPLLVRVAVEIVAAVDRHDHAVAQRGGASEPPGDALAIPGGPLVEASASQCLDETCPRSRFVGPPGVRSLVWRRLLRPSVPGSVAV
jgi:hypothetical protein